MQDESRQEVASETKGCGRLVLTRKVGQVIYLDGGRIKIVVVANNGKSVRLGFEAPPEIRIDREEIHLKRERERNVGA